MLDPNEWFESEKKSPPPPFDWEDTAPSEYEPPTDNRWSRTWTAKTRDGEERTLEVYEKKEDGEWISLMYGNAGDIYYQNSLGYEINTES